MNLADGARPLFHRIVPMDVEHITFQRLERRVARQSAAMAQEIEDEAANTIKRMRVDQ